MCFLNILIWEQLSAQEDQQYSQAVSQSAGGLMAWSVFSLCLPQFLALHKEAMASCKSVCLSVCIKIADFCLQQFPDDFLCNSDTPLRSAVVVNLTGP